MTPQEQDDVQVRQNLQALARYIDKQLPYGWGFILLAFPFGADGRMNYVANAKRNDVVRAMYEFIESSRISWSEHVPEDEARDDAELGRLRQRVAYLEKLLSDHGISIGHFGSGTK